VVLSPNRAAANLIDDVIAQARSAFDTGVSHVWISQQSDVDAIALAGLVGAAVPGLGVGTAVVPINPWHPLTLDSAAQTAQAAAHGNFSLGLGLGAHELERRAFGISPAHTVQRLREHLTVLRSVLTSGTVNFRGEEITAAPQWPVTVPGGIPFPIYVAAMGPRALQVTGELAEGTLPFLAGPRTIEEFIAPTITKAAADAGRPAPRVIAMVPVAVTDDERAARVEAATRLGFYDQIPSYQKVIAREGAAGAADLALIGTAQSVIRQLGAYRDAGATDLLLFHLQIEPDPPALKRTWEVAAALQDG
jgi:F420-dependent oxidoreductase-like protein